jgi:hypothetical protein
MTVTTCPGCPNCLLTQRISTVSANLDPDRLADRVRAVLRTGTVDEIDGDLLHFGDYELMVDVAGREVWEGDWHRGAQDQLHLGLVHVAAALAAGAHL